MVRSFDTCLSSRASNESSPCAVWVVQSLSLMRSPIIRAELANFQKLVGHLAQRQFGGCCKVYDPGCSPRQRRCHILFVWSSWLEFAWRSIKKEIKRRARESRKALNGWKEAISGKSLGQETSLCDDTWERCESRTRLRKTRKPKIELPEKS